MLPGPCPWEPKRLLEEYVSLAPEFMFFIFILGLSKHAPPTLFYVMSLLFTHASFYIHTVKPSILTFSRTLIPPTPPMPRMPLRPCQLLVSVAAQARGARPAGSLPICTHRNGTIQMPSTMLAERAGTSRRPRGVCFRSGGMDTPAALAASRALWPGRGGMMCSHAQFEWKPQK